MDAKSMDAMAANFSFVVISLSIYYLAIVVVVCRALFTRLVLDASPLLLTFTISKHNL